MPKEKYPKERAPEAAAPLRGVPCASQGNRRAPDSQFARAIASGADPLEQLKQGGALLPIAPAMLGGGYGSSTSTTTRASVGAAFGRVPIPSYRSRPKAAPTKPGFPVLTFPPRRRSRAPQPFCEEASLLFELFERRDVEDDAPSELRVRRARKRARSAGYPDMLFVAGQAVGVPFSLVTFSWASKRK